MKISKLVTLFLSMIATSAMAQDAIKTRSSKQIWLEFSGQSTCEKNYCAEEIPARPLELALNFYEENKDIIENDKYIGIVDYSISSTKKRFWILNLSNGSYTSMHVTHGKNSEGRLSYSDSFSNVIGSEQSSIGFYVTAEGTYFGKHGESLRLRGLSKTNSNAWERAIVIHAADYAGTWIIDTKGRLGLSQGCPAVAKDKIQMVLKRLKGKSLFFGYHPKFEEVIKAK